MLWILAVELAKIQEGGLLRSKNGVKRVKHSRVTPDGRNWDSSLAIQQRKSRNENKKEDKWSWGTVATLENYSNPKTILLDYDMARPVPNLIRILSRIRIVGLTAKWVSYSRTKRGWHVALGINYPLIPSESVALQAVLGSDLARETMNLRRAIAIRVHGVTPHWKKRWNILFKEKLN
jgi:hypothetical protein